MGNTAQSPEPVKASPSVDTSLSSNKPMQECPMRDKITIQLLESDKNDIGGCPIKQNQSKSTISSTSSAYKNPNQYNVYSEKIDPANQMPNLANQSPSPGQAVQISTDRVVSSIPKGGTDDQTWVYPSPQMFWNALIRKNKVDGATERDMDTVVAIHNNMNENTWRQVLSWEELHPSPSPDRSPKLLRFQGKPDTLSPKARLKTLFGHPVPFDRHDWVVDRGGQEVRYVIDYYHDEDGVDKDTRPSHMQDFHSMQSIKVDVRPALDSFEAIIDRVARMPLKQFSGQTHFDPPPFFLPSPVKLSLERKKRLLNDQWSEIQLKCVSFRDQLRTCTTDDECGGASIALQRCTASVVCPDIVAEFDSCTKDYHEQQQKQFYRNKNVKVSTNTNIAPDPSQASAEENVAAAYGKMEQCLALFKADSESARKS